MQINHRLNVRIERRFVSGQEVTSIYPKPKWAVTLIQDAYGMPHKTAVVRYDSVASRHSFTTLDTLSHWFDRYGIPEEGDCTKLVDSADFIMLCLNRENMQVDYSNQPTVKCQMHINQYPHYGYLYVGRFPVWFNRIIRLLPFHTSRSSQLIEVEDRETIRRLKSRYNVLSRDMEALSSDVGMDETRGIVRIPYIDALDLIVRGKLTNYILT